MFKMALPALVVATMLTVGPADAGQPTCNLLGNLVNGILLQPSCEERIKRYDFEHSEAAVVDLADIYGNHSPEHPSEKYHRVRDSYGNDAWERNEK